jgi:CubicO group peptidase (beta-lactamase class C family)
MTTIAVMQCVERKLLDLDQDVSTTWLPEFQEIDILLRIEEDANGNKTPITKKSRNPITLRNLLNHSSGLAYEFTHPKLEAWRRWTNSTNDGRKLSRSTHISEALRVPLIFEPGTSWIYGYGIDWAGLAVMRATTISLEEYMTTYIWRPLGMASTTFSPTKFRPELLARFAAMNERGDGGEVVYTDGREVYAMTERLDFGGGGGCFSTANDYIRLLTSLLATATATASPVNDGAAAVPQLLARSSLDAMFSPTLSPASTSALKTIVASPLAAGLAGNLPAEVAMSWGLGGILNLDVVPTSGRAKGGMQWSGLPNLFWWISPGDGVCGCYFGQLLPPGDRPSLDMYSAFEKAVLEERRAAVAAAKL